MKIAPGLTTHTVVVVTEKRERGLSIQAVLAKGGLKVVLAQSIYDALRFVAQEMPHLVLTEALLADGSAGTLYDRLQQHEILRKTPILVHVVRKTRAELAPLAQRDFAGFLLGKVEPKALFAKVKEVLNARSPISPHFVPASACGFTPSIQVCTDVSVLGALRGYVVCRSTSKVESDAELIYVPKNPALEPAVLRRGTNVQIKGVIFNLFPMNGVSGVGRTWMTRLPDLTAGEVASEAAVLTAQAPLENEAPSLSEMRRVLFHMQNKEYLAGYQEVLKGFDIEVEAAPDLKAAAEAVIRNPGRYAAVYIHGFQTDQERLFWHNSTCRIDPKVKPPVIVGVVQRSSISIGDMRYLKRPFGLGRFLETLEGAFRQGEVLDRLSTLKEGSTGIVGGYRNHATLLGLDETGGLFEISFPLARGGRVDLENDFLQRAWDGQRSVVITSVQPVPGEPDHWHCRFEAVSVGTSKTKYWEKVHQLIEATRPPVTEAPIADDQGLGADDGEPGFDELELDAEALGDDIKDLELPETG